jgi:hypothetical protein
VCGGYCNNQYWIACPRQPFQIFEKTLTHNFPHKPTIRHSFTIFYVRRSMEYTFPMDGLDIRPDGYRPPLETPAQNEVKDAIADMKYLQLTCKDLKVRLADDSSEGAKNCGSLAQLRAAAQQRALFMLKNRSTSSRDWTAPMSKGHTHDDVDDLFLADSSRKESK